MVENRPKGIIVETVSTLYDKRQTEYVKMRVSYLV